MELRLRPRFVWRDYHSLQRADDWKALPLVAVRGKLAYRPNDDFPPLTLLHSGDADASQPYWFYQCLYDVEQRRGLDHLEDHWSPAELSFALSPDAPTQYMIATMDESRAESSTGDAPQLVADELARREKARISVCVSESLPPTAGDALVELAQRADDYLVRRDGDRWTILAGYPWFTDWGRDTMIALPGLAFARGKLDVARSVISTYGDYADQGMIPNRFPDRGETPEYNTVDATLWHFEAVRRYAELRPDDAIIRDEWFPLLCNMLGWHRDGTRYGIRVDEDGLLRAGEGASQLTWMDARIGDWTVTPRIGKPVEVNALWHNALRTVEALAAAYGAAETQRQCREDAERAAESIQRRFPNPHGEGLYDVIDGPDGDDPTVRPNQVFAVSLHHRALDAETEREVVRVAERRLFTAVGLRSLAPNHPDYRPVYEGGPLDRDGSYHQGPVWGWLWGPFVTAYGNAFGRDAFRAKLAEWLTALLTERDERGGGGVAEIYDGQSPHGARGCPWQGWSVAEVLRVAVEEGVMDVT